MHILDVGIMVLVAIGAVRGYATGVLRQVGSVAGAILAFFFAAGLMTPVGEYVTEWFGWESDVGPVLGFIVVFAVIFVLALLAVRFMEAAFSRSQLTSLNHFMGAVTGGLVAALLASAFFVVGAYVGMPADSAREESHLYAPTAGLAPVVWSYMSANRDTFLAITERLDIEGLKDWVGPAHRPPKPPPPRRYDR